MKIFNKYEEPKPEVLTLEQKLEVPLSQTRLDIRTCNILEKIGVLTVGELLQQSSKDLMQIPNFGKKTMNCVFKALEEYGFVRKRVSFNYDEFINSDFWKTITKIIIKRDRYKCEICKGEASIVHHIGYDPKVLFGSRPEMLVSCCPECYTHLHLTTDGMLRYTHVAKRSLRLLFKLEFIPNQSNPEIGKKLKKRTNKNRSVKDRIRRKLGKEQDLFAHLREQQLIDSIREIS